MYYVRIKISYICSKLNPAQRTGIVYKVTLYLFTKAQINKHLFIVNKTSYTQPWTFIFSIVIEFEILY